MQFMETRCPECGRGNPIEAWFAAASGIARGNAGEGDEP
jgi:hypothetical protein